MQLAHEVIDAPARVPFRIARHTYHSFGLVQVTLTSGGITGHGEAPPNRFYGETTDTVTSVLARLAEAIEDPWDWSGWQERSRRTLPKGHPSARSAVECALLDWCGQERGAPVWQLLDIPAGPVPESSASLGIDTPQATVAAARALWDSGWQRLKVKLGWGSPQEEGDVVRAVRAALPGAALTVDANAGWTVQQARLVIPVLADLGVELLEQPLPVGEEDATRELAERSPIPVFLDESITSPADVDRLADSCHGVNVKVSKLGGPLSSLTAIRRARAHGLRVMLGCMGESSLALAPAVHLGPLADVVDLFGPHALADDPSVGLTWDGPLVSLPQSPGLGVRPRSAASRSAPR